MCEQYNIDRCRSVLWTSAHQNVNYILVEIYGYSSIECPSFVFLLQTTQIFCCAENDGHFAVHVAFCVDFYNNALRRFFVDACVVDLTEKKILSMCFAIKVTSD